MNNLNDLSNFFKEIPIQGIYGALAVAGGIARYLSSYASGQHFSFGILIASAFVSGFSGYMFALFGMTMGMPQPILFMMAGTGGFFGDQTMKFLMEWINQKTGTNIGNMNKDGV